MARGENLGRHSLYLPARDLSAGGGTARVAIDAVEASTLSVILVTAS